MEPFLVYLNSPVGQRVLTSIVCVLLGALAGWLGARLRRFRQQKQVETGDAREVATIEKVLLVPTGDGRLSLRIRSCGRDPIDLIFPNPVARDAFHGRIVETTPACPLISMEGKLGSYLLEELAIWVCGQVGEHNFPRDVWVMAAASEPSLLGGHQSTSILLVRREDLARCREWPVCKEFLVEHGLHGQRILTLLGMAAEFERQNAAIKRRRAEGRRSNFEETMYVLDLGLDTRIADLPAKPVPWGRFESALKEMGLE